MDTKSRDLVTKAICYGYYLANHHQVVRDRRTEDHLYASHATQQAWPVWDQYAEAFLENFDHESPTVFPPDPR
jgi:hypothetical protein